LLLEHLALQIASRPREAAVVAEDRTISYLELDWRSAAVAALLQARNPAPDALVAIYLKRCTDLIAAIVGVMRAGCAYTVVEDSGHLAEHRHRLSQIGAAWVLTDAARAPALRDAGLPVLELPQSQLDERMLTEALATEALATQPLKTRSASSLAYVLFTSGSTGVPKGVAITHANIAHYVGSLLGRLGIESALSYAHVSTLAADLGNTSLLLSLWTGGTLHLLGETLRKDPAGLLDYLSREQIDLLKITPSHWRAVLQARSASVKLRYLILGGEALSVQLARETLRAGVTDVLVNHYGPTEATVGVATFALRDAAEVDQLQTQTVPVGWPLGKTRALVCDVDGQFHARDAVGELYIGGPSVAAGYFRNPEATAARFVTDIEGDTRFYRTGDRVRIHASGAIEFLGRNDRQVKINGYRIELEHVEHALRDAGCKEAAAYVFELHGRPAIVAAVNAGEGEASLTAVRQRLASRLPGHMHPKVFEPFTTFPRNDNGKTDFKALQGLLEARLRDLEAAKDEQPGEGPDESGNELVRVVREAWRDRLGHARFGNDENFFAAGGDSLDAIQLIAKLQADGHHVSAYGFLQEPTVRALAAQLAANAAGATERADRAPHVPILRDEQFTAIQRWFFAQNFAQADHYNQAILVECEQPLALELLRRAVRRLCEWHPLLTARYRRKGSRWVAERGDCVDRELPVVGTSTIEASSEDEADRQIRELAQALHAWLSLDAGRLFAVHLFTRAQGPQQLLLIGHHLSVDAVSWRVLLADLVRLYETYASGEPEPVPPAGTPLWDWATRLGARKQEFEVDLAYWRSLPRHALKRRLGGGDRANIEARAQTAWMAFSAEQTAALQTTLPSRFGSPFHHILLAAFYRALRLRGVAAEPDLLVEVESHGRLSLDEHTDISRAVGWATSSYPVLLTLQAGELAEYVSHAESVLSAVPRLGLAYGLHADTLANEWGGLPVPPLSYNYLGEFEPVRGKRLSLTYSRHSPGIARGGGNLRGAELKLTARLIDGQLFADLCFDAGRYSLDTIKALCISTREQLLQAAGLEHGQPDTGIACKQGSSSGLLTYAPGALRWHCESRATDRRRYAQVLLTGASGYLGVFVLRELLVSTDAHVHCLVRDHQRNDPAARLAAIFEWYFPDTPLANWQGRYSVITGDIGHVRLGLDPAGYERLSSQIEAIYHFAADTRLFSSDSRAQLQHNVDGTRHVLELARDRRSKHVHYMSTLVVCGINGSGRPARFAESELNIGQEFQNDYERSKFQAEQLVNEFAARGGTGLIYRAGNVSADSRSGRFQRNGADNRLVQFLKAIVQLGQLPRVVDENIVLSPVDIVARGILALSLNPALEGGVYHVESPWEIPLQSLFTELAALGVRLEVSACESFAELFRCSRRLHERDISLGYFWATRKARGVIFDHSKTLRLLNEHAVSFPNPTPGWLRAFLAHLIDGSVLSRGASEPALVPSPNGPYPEALQDSLPGFIRTQSPSPEYRL